MISEETQKVAIALAAKMIDEKKSLQEISGISDDLLEEIYSLAYTYYEQGNIKASTALFYLLVSVNPKSYKFLLGLAGSYHRGREWEKASLAFATALTLDNSDPSPAYFAAEAVLKLGETEDAKFFLKSAISIAGDKEEYAILKERSELIYQNLTNN